MRKFKAKQRKSRVQYNPYTSWDDVHFRSAAVLMLEMLVLSFVLCMLQLHSVLVNALASSDDIVLHVFPAVELCPDIHNTLVYQLQFNSLSSGEILLQSNAQTSQYYFKRLILLSADVALYPEPTSEIEIMPQAIKELNDKTTTELQQV